MNGLGKSLIAMGAVLVLAGFMLVLGHRLNLPLGKLPGDLTWRGKNTTVFFPLASSIVISIVLSLLFWLFQRNGR